jgi:hypothetical protein
VPGNRLLQLTLDELEAGVPTVGDLDDNGRPEIIGGWEELAMEPIWPRPVVIAWDDGKGAYRIAPLLSAAAGPFA